MSDPIRVDGFKARKRMEFPKHNRPRFTSPIRIRSVLWLPALLGLLYGAQEEGTPHLRFQYKYEDRSTYRYFYFCDYVGLHSRRVIPHNGECPLFLMLKEPEKK